jgi:hypothetical protein
MKRPNSMTLGEQVEEAPTGTPAAKQTPSFRPTLACSEVRDRPTAAYLRHLILTLNGDTSTPLGIRGECEMLMLAINANDLTEIIDRLARLERLADENGLKLPRLNKEPSHRD